MIITIEGKQGEGKTVLAGMITEGKTCHYLNHGDIKRMAKVVESVKHDDYIVIDDIVDYDAVYTFFKKRISNGLKTPDIILIKQREL